MLDILRDGLKIGARVIYVDSFAQQHEALVTAVWGDPATSVPCINIVHVNSNEAMGDVYGRQIARSTSLCHRSVNPAHGNYYMMPGEVANPVLEAAMK